MGKRSNDELAFTTKVAREDMKQSVKAYESGRNTEITKQLKPSFQSTYILISPIVALTCPGFGSSTVTMFTSDRDGNPSAAWLRTGFDRTALSPKGNRDSSARLETVQFPSGSSHSVWINCAELTDNSFLPALLSEFSCRGDRGSAAGVWTSSSAIVALVLLRAEGKGEWTLPMTESGLFPGSCSKSGE